MPIYQLDSDSPKIEEEVYIAPSADLIGDVVIEERSNIWFQVVVRGDVDRIRIGQETNIQDQSMLHLREGMPLTIGDRVTIGHGAQLHACTIESETLIGIGAKILDGATIRKHSMVAAGAIVTPGTEVPPGAVYMGSPAQLARNLREDELEMIKESARMYVERAQLYRNKLSTDSN